jgi:hypothetical protein
MLISGWIGESPKVSEIVLLYNPSLKSREYKATRDPPPWFFQRTSASTGGIRYIRLPPNGNLMQRVSECESVVFCGGGGQPCGLAAAVRARPFPLHIKKALASKGFKKRDASAA